MAEAETKKGKCHLYAYHMTRLDNVASIFEDGRILSSGTMRNADAKFGDIGSGSITERRFKNKLKCHRGSVYVNDCVPFYFRPMSAMLSHLHFIKSNKNNFDPNFGQNQIAYLICDLEDTMIWAEKASNLWAFTDGNAGSKHWNFNSYSSRDEVKDLDWDTILTANSADPRTQAEFLVQDFVDVSCIQEVVVRTEGSKKSLLRQITDIEITPNIFVEPNLYY